jgi:hypothetical protein
MAQRVLRVLRRLPRMVWRRENIPVAAVAGQRASDAALLLHIECKPVSCAEPGVAVELRGPCSFGCEEGWLLALVDCVRSAGLLLLRTATVAVLLTLVC